MFDQIIKNILPSLEHLGIGGYWIAFFAALLETTIGLGLILSGSTIILFLGALSAGGYLDVGDLIWFSVLGAVIGDNINYFLGRKYFNKWLQEGFWFLKAGHVEKAGHFMDTHGAKRKKGSQVESAGKSRQRVEGVSPPHGKGWRPAMAPSHAPGPSVRMAAKR